MSDRYLTAKEVADRVKFNVDHIRNRWPKQKDKPQPHRHGRILRWLESDIERWMNPQNLPNSPQGH